MNLSDTNSLDYYEYTFDSLEATNAASDSYTSRNWPNFKMDNPLMNVVGVKVIEAEIPFSFYTVSSFNNTFQVSYNGGAYVTLTVPVGNYSAASLATQLQTLLVTVDASFTVSIDAVASKFLFTAALTFVFNFPNTMQTDMRLLMGFDSVSPTAVLSAGLFRLTSVNVYQVTGSNFLHVCSNRLGPLMNIYLPSNDVNSKGGIGPQIAKIQVNVNPYDVIFWRDPTPDLIFNIKNVFQLKEMDFYLAAAEGGVETPLDLNGLGFSLKLALLVAQDEHASTAREGGVTKIRRLK